MYGSVLRRILCRTQSGFQWRRHWHHGNTGMTRMLHACGTVDHSVRCSQKLRIHLIRQSKILFLKIRTNHLKPVHILIPVSEVELQKFGKQLYANIRILTANQTICDSGIISEIIIQNVNSQIPRCSGKQDIPTLHFCGATILSVRFCFRSECTPVKSTCSYEIFSAVPPRGSYHFYASEKLIRVKQFSRF